MQLESLTEREIGILTFLIEGLSNREIGEKLSIAESTVKWHIRQLNAKFQTKNRIELSSRARQWHLLSNKGVLLNAPSEVTPFVGRKADIDAISQQITHLDKGLVTLLGPGGIGKTRLAIVVAARCATHFHHGAVFVGLQGMNDESLFISTIAKSVGLILGTEQNLQKGIEHLAYYFEQNPMLVLLDNIEHLSNASAELSQLLQYTTRTRFLVTSRERLNIQEETVYLLKGLQFPSLKVSTNDMSDIASYDAVQLFTERAHHVKADFQLESEFEDVMRICQIVEGLPLAIELAASWRNVLSCADIVAELEQSMDLLSTQVQNIPSRHKSMKVVFEHTWRRLTPEERRIYMRLSIFQGGFSRQAAEKVAGASLLILASLLNQTIIHMGHSSRYYMHELTRQFGRERLADNPSEEQATQESYTTYFADYVHIRLTDISHGDQLGASKELQAELDNIRTAIKFAFETQSTDLISKLCCESLTQFLQYESRYLEAYEIFHQAAEILDTKNPTLDAQLALLDILKGLAWFQLRLGQLDKVEITAQRGYEIYDSLNSLPENVHLSNPQCITGFAMLAQVNYERTIEIATTILEQGKMYDQQIDVQFAHYLFADAYQAQGKLDIAREHALKSYQITQTYGDRWFSSYVLNKLGLLSRFSGDLDVARHYISESHTVREAFGDKEGMALSLSYLGDVELQDKNYDTALEYFEKSLTLFEQINDTGGLASTNMALGVAAYMIGDAARSQKHILIALDLATKIEYLYMLSILFSELSQWLWQADEIEHSLTLLAFSAQHHGIDYINHTAAETKLQAYKEIVDPGLFAQATAKGTQLSFHELVRELRPVLNALSIFERNQTLVDEDTRQEGVDALTPREIEVLKLIADGFSNTEIAEKLVIAIGTVKYHTAQIYSKLDIHSRVQALREAQKHHLI